MACSIRLFEATTKLKFDNWNKNQIILLILVVGNVTVTLIPFSNLIQNSLQAGLIMVFFDVVTEFVFWILYGTRVPGFAEFQDKMILVYLGNFNQF